MEQETILEREALDKVVSQLNNLLVSVDNHINENSRTFSDDMISKWKQTYTEMSKELYSLQTGNPTMKKVRSILESLREKFIQIAHKLASVETISHFIVSVLVMFTSSIAVYFVTSNMKETLSPTKKHKPSKKK